MNENLRLYEAVRKVPDNAKKAFFNGSFNGTDINPMWRIKTLTEQFGVAGIGWYTEVISERAETYGDTVMAIVDINLYVKVNGEWSKPIFGTGGNRLVTASKSGSKASDEGYKMAYTDALSVACKALGIGADVYFERDITKYSAYETPPQDELKPGDGKKLAVEQSAPAQVKTSATVPTPAPTTTSWNPNKAIQKWCEGKGVTSTMFSARRSQLISTGIVENIAYSQLDPDHFDKLIKAMEANFQGEAAS